MHDTKKSKGSTGRWITVDCYIAFISFCHCMYLKSYLQRHWPHSRGTRQGDWISSSDRWRGTQDQRRVRDGPEAEKSGQLVWRTTSVALFASPQDGNLEVHLKLMERLRVAVEFFNHNNPGSVLLSHVVRERGDRCKGAICEAVQS